MKLWIARIDYKGGLNPAFDAELDALAKKYGGRGDSSGVSIPTGRRDISWSFKTKEKADRFMGTVRRVGRWKSRGRKRVFSVED